MKLTNPKARVSGEVHANADAGGRGPSDSLHKHLRMLGAPVRRSRARRWLVIACVVCGLGLFVSAYFAVWWKFTLYAPQYPGGLSLLLSLTGINGDVREINTLNHYIGMGHLDQAARLERQFAGFGIGLVCSAVLGLALVAGRRVGKLIAAVGLAFPVLFLADSIYWLYRFGHELDPHAPLKIEPFTPQMFGNGQIGQFMTFAEPGAGFWLALAGVCLLVLAVVLRERVCKTCPGRDSCGLLCRRTFVAGPGAAPAEDRKPSPSQRPPQPPSQPPSQGVLRGSATFLTLVLVSAVATRAQSSAPERSNVAASEPSRASGVFAENEADFRRLLSDPTVPEIALRSKVYHGDWVVRRSVRIHGTSGTILEGSRRGTVISLEAPDCVLENVSVRGSGARHTAEDAGIKAKAARIRIRNVRVEDALFGISLGPCEHCLLENAEVRGEADRRELVGDGVKLWEASDSQVRNCRISHVRDMVVWYSRRVLIESNTITHSRYGVHFMYAHDSLLRKNRITDNVVSVFVMYSARLRADDNLLAGAKGAAGIGIGFKESDSVALRDNRIIGNTVGVYLDRTPRTPKLPVHFEHNLWSLNSVALRFHASEEGVDFRHNDFRDNLTTAEVEGGGDALGAQFSANYWSDYAGYDLGRDGTGDVAFEVKQLSSELTETHPSLKLFAGTAALESLDMLAHAVPVLASRTLLRDGTPAMTPYWSTL